MTTDKSRADALTDERAAKKPDAMTKSVKQLADWLLTEPNDGNPLCFAGPPEPFVLGLSRVKMRSVAGTEWTLIAGLQEGWLTAEQRAANFWRIAKLEREEVAREEDDEAAHIAPAPAPAPADERAAFESLKGAWQSMPPFDVFCAGWQAARAASANETGAEGAPIVQAGRDVLVTHVPSRIYLNLGDINELGEIPFQQLTGVTWCEDRVDDTDIEYVRAPAQAAAAAFNAARAQGGDHDQ